MFEAILPHGVLLDGLAGARSALRLTTLLARCVERLGGESAGVEEVRALTVGDREALALALRMATFGDRLARLLDCRPAASAWISSCRPPSCCMRRTRARARRTRSRSQEAAPCAFACRRAPTGRRRPRSRTSRRARGCWCERCVLSMHGRAGVSRVI